MRVLLTHSILDPSVQRRMDQINNSPRLRQYTIGHFIIWPNRYRNYTKLQSRLIEKILVFQPDVVVVHFGMAFLHDRVAFLREFNAVIPQYPKISFVSDSLAMVADPATLAMLDPLDRSAVFEPHEFKGKLASDDPQLYELAMLTR